MAIGLTDEQLNQLNITDSGVKGLTDEELDALEKRPTRRFAGEILPIGGAILGGFGGAALGGIAGGPFGAYAGGVVGTGVGAAVGETGQELIERRFGARRAISPQEIGKTGLEMGAIEAIGGPVATVGGKLLKGVGAGVAKAVIPTSAREAILLQAYKARVPLLERIGTALSGRITKSPITMAETAFQKGLMGAESVIGVQAKKATTNLWENLISPQLKRSTERVDIPSFFKEAERKIIKETPERSRRNDLLNALKALGEDYVGIRSVGLDGLQKFKEGWAKFIPEKVYRGKPIAGAFNDVKDILSDLSRSKIYNSLGPEVKRAYIDYGNLKGLQELGQRAMTGGKLRGGFGSFWSAIKDKALVPAGTIGGQTLYKVGRVAEFIGKPGARLVRDLFGTQLGKDITGTPISDTSEETTILNSPQSPQ